MGEIMSGSYSDAYPIRESIRITGSVWTQDAYAITGSAHSRQYEFIGIDKYIHDPRIEALWEMMYVNPKPVILVCGACGSHNVVSSPTCVQCGAPARWGKERQYG